MSPLALEDPATRWVIDWKPRLGGADPPADVPEDSEADTLEDDEPVVPEDNDPEGAMLLFTARTVFPAINKHVYNNVYAQQWY